MVILDPSKENDCPAGFTLIESEIDFLRLDDPTVQLFVRGEALCRWVNVLCRARAVECRELPSPRERLRALLGKHADAVEAAVLKNAVGFLSENENVTLGQLLMYLTNDVFWSAPPSREHCARWLLASFDQELEPLVAAAREFWTKECADDALKGLYVLPTDERERQLENWLNAEGTDSDLGTFPLAVQGETAKLLQRGWGRRLRETEGRAIEKLSHYDLNAQLVVAAAYEYFGHHPNNLTIGIAQQIGSLLPAAQRARLEKLTPPIPPQPLAAEAQLEAALSWTKEYLPYREWQVSSGSVEEAAKAEMLGGSFADWLLENYPRLTTKGWEDSPLNLRGKYLVAELTKSHQVLWVVVDGLNYLNHQRLLRLLAQTEAALAVERDRELLAALPTITKTAKYSLTSGLFPQQNQNGEWDTRKVLAASFPDARYAGVDQIGHLKNFLADETVRLCYWNMTAIDNCYHKQTDLKGIANNVGAQLKALAENISDLVLASADPDRLAVVISTDHGQMLGPCVKWDNRLKDGHGRTVEKSLFATDSQAAYTKSPDSATVVLNPISFRLSAPTTLALQSFYFGEWAKDAQGRAWGVHGGLFPEEVVVGFSVLVRRPQRQPITVTISGSGETGRPGTIILHVDNPNAAPVKLLELTLAEIGEYQQMCSLLAEVDRDSNRKIELELERFPAPTHDDNLPLTGKLIYEFSDGLRQECEVSGTLSCKQMYGGQRPSLRDRFKK